MKVGDIVPLRGTEAVVYHVTDDYFMAELLHDTPVTEGTNDFAAMVLRDPRDPLGNGGHKGDFFKVTR